MSTKYRYSLTATILAGAAALASTAAADTTKTTTISSILTRVNGATYIKFPGSTPYGCDNPDTSIYDFPYFERTWVNAESGKSIALAAFLSGKTVNVTYNDDCRITAITIQ